MEHFKTKDEIEGTAWHEFYRGKWDSKFWSENSLYLDDTKMSGSGLGKLLHSQIPGYSKYGISVISAEQWERIRNIAEGEAAEIVREAEEWVASALAECGYFTVLGI